MATSTSEGK